LSLTLYVSSLLGACYYTDPTLAIIAGASLDRWGAKYTIQIGIAFLAITRKFLKCIFIFILSAFALEWARARTPEDRLVSIEDIGNLAAFLVSDGATALAGNIEYVNAGYHIVG
jgi:MFS family permease